MDLARIASPFRMQPGLARLDGPAPPTPSRPGGRHLREKTTVLARWPREALCSVPGFDAEPVLAAIAREAAAQGAGGTAFLHRGPVDAAAPLIGWRVVGGRVEGDGEARIGRVLEALPVARRTMALCALAFEEDFALLEGAGTTLPWLAVALPSRWAPREKLGLPFAAVHAPVADAQRLIEAAPALVRLVTAGGRHERRVWTVSANRRLHQHPARPPAAWPAEAEPGSDADAGALAAMASFRHEVQRFFPLHEGGAGASVFTIRVESVPLAAAVRTPAEAQALHDAIASMSPAVLAYKGLAPARDRLLRWLAARR